MIEHEGAILFSLGEASRLSRVSEKALRYYDKRGIIAPTWRDPETGYRYYDIETVYMMENRLVAKGLDLAVKEYDDILISDENIARGDFSPVYENVHKIISRKRDEIERLFQQLDSLLEIERDIVTMSSHQLNGATFDLPFDRQSVAIMPPDDQRRREVKEAEFYEVFNALESVANRRYGRIWSLAGLFANDLEGNGFFIELSGDLRRMPLLPQALQEHARFCAVAEGVYPCALMNHLYEQAPWENLKARALELNLDPERTLAIAHEIGLYRSYEHFRDIIHLVRLVPEDALQAF